MIHLKNIVKTYADDIHALRGINLHIAPGSIYGIIGLSGAGKSTLIRCINMLERPTSGEVLVGGRDLMQMSEAELREERRHIGMIFQHFNLLSSATVYDNAPSPAARSSASASHARSRATRRYCCAMRQPLRSTRRRRSPSLPSSATSTAVWG